MLYVLQLVLSMRLCCLHLLWNDKCVIAIFVCDDLFVDVKGATHESWEEYGGKVQYLMCLKHRARRIK